MIADLKVLNFDSADAGSGADVCVPLSKYLGSMHRPKRRVEMIGHILMRSRLCVCDLFN